MSRADADRVRRDAVLLGAAAALIFALQALAWPLQAGRDLGTYVLYYNQLWDARPAWHTVMLFRTPLVPLFIGGLYRLGGSGLLEAALGLLFVASVVAIYAFASVWSRPVALTAAAVTALYPTYGALFHEASSDAPYAAGIALWAAGVTRTTHRPTVARFVGHGVAVFLLVMIRPTAQVLLLFVLFPFLLRGMAMRRRIQAAAAFLATAGTLLAAWASYNALRYDDFAVARGGAAQVPFYRVFVADRLVRRQNGPASEALARAVETDLLRRQPYAAHGYDADTLLGSGDPKVWSDLAALSDRYFGWHTDHRILRQAAIESIRAHPRRYLAGVTYAVDFALRGELAPPAPTRRHAALPGAATERFTPSDGELVPRSYLHWLASAPQPPRVRPGTDAPEAEPGAGAPPGWTINLGEQSLPVRDGVPWVAALFNAGLRRLYPPMLAFLLVGAVGVLWARHPAAPLLLFLAALALVHAVMVCAAVTLGVRYRVPFDPVFVTLGVAGFLRRGPRGSAGETRPGGTPATRA